MRVRKRDVSKVMSRFPTGQVVVSFIETGKSEEEAGLVGERSKDQIWACQSSPSENSNENPGRRWQWPELEMVGRADNWGSIKDIGLADCQDVREEGKGQGDSQI